MNAIKTTEQDYYATAYVRVRATTEAEAVAMIEAAFTMEEEHESIEGVFLTVCGGPWAGVEPVSEEDPCICPPEYIARDDGSFRGGCPVHG
jgi:hypothetical protein